MIAPTNATASRIGRTSPAPVFESLEFGHGDRLARALVLVLEPVSIKRPRAAIGLSPLPVAAADWCLPRIGGAYEETKPMTARPAAPSDVSRRTSLGDRFLGPALEEWQPGGRMLQLPPGMVSKY